MEAKTRHDALAMQNDAPSSANVVPSMKSEDEKGYRYQQTRMQRRNERPESIRARICTRMVCIRKGND